MSLNKNLCQAKQQKKDNFTRSFLTSRMSFATTPNISEVKLCTAIAMNPASPTFSNTSHTTSSAWCSKGTYSCATKTRTATYLVVIMWSRPYGSNTRGNSKGSKVPDVGNIGVHAFEEGGDFRTAESIEHLKQVEIVVTNPSLFAVPQLCCPISQICSRYLQKLD